jgi:DNA-binding PadR family transcriptional regulator
MGKGDHVGEFEHKVLMTVLSLRGAAYGMMIRRELRESGGRDVSIGSVYATLDRLEEKGWVKSWEGDPTPERGGRAKKFFEVTSGGERVLREFDRDYMKRRRGVSRRLAWGAS